MNSRNFYIDDWTSLAFFGIARIPNFYNLCKMYWKKAKPYYATTLPNLRLVNGCWNCKHAETLDCGSHFETSCGICRDSVHGHKICDLWEEDMRLVLG